jgi:hypothetical protein
VEIKSGKRCKKVSGKNAGHDKRSSQKELLDIDLSHCVLGCNVYNYLLWCYLGIISNSLQGVVSLHNDVSIISIWSWGFGLDVWCFFPVGATYMYRNIFSEKQRKSFSEGLLGYFLIMDEL